MICDDKFMSIIFAPQVPEWFARKILLLIATRLYSGMMFDIFLSKLQTLLPKVLEMIGKKLVGQIEDHIRFSEGNHHW